MRPNRIVWIAAILCLVVLVAAVTLVLLRRAPALHTAAVAPAPAIRPVVRVPTPPPAAGSPGFHGTITTAAGKPAEGAHVQLFPDRLTTEGNSPCPEDPPNTPLLEASCGRAVVPLLLQALDSGQLEGGPLAEATADVQGRFQLPGNAGVHYRVCAEKGEELACAEERAAPAEVALPLAAAGKLYVEVITDEGINPTVALVQAAPPAVRRAVADGKGHILFEGLAEGTQVCLARAEHYRAEMRDATGFPETEQFLMHLVLLARVAGRVLDGEAPVRGAAVLMEQIDGELSVVSDEGGRFGFAEGPCEWQFDVAARLGDRVGHTHVRRHDGTTDIVVRLQPSGRISLRVLGAPEDTAATATLISEQGSVRTLHQPPYVFDALVPGRHELTVDVPGLKQERLHLTLEPGQQIEREVRLTKGETLSGVVVDEAGKPVPLAELSAWFVVHPEMPKGRFERLDHASGRYEADGSGIFEIGLLNAGPNLIKARADGYFETEQEVQLPAAGLRIVLRRGVSLAGRVVDERDRPVVHATVTAVSARAAVAEYHRLEEQLHGTHAQGDIMALFNRLHECGERMNKELMLNSRARAVTNASGDFLLQSLEEVQYDVRASADGFGEASLRAHAPATGLRLVLFAGASLTVRVVDERGAPVEASSVIAERQPPISDSDEKSFECDEKQGAWQAEDLPAGSYRIKARVRDHPDSFAAASLAAGAHAEVTVKVERGEEISGETVDEKGAPLAGVTIFLKFAGEDAEDRSALSDAQGRFSFAALPKRDRPAHLVAMMDEVDREHAKVDVAPGTREVRLVLALRPRFDGRILTPDGKAPTQCSLHLGTAQTAASKMHFIVEVTGMASGGHGPTVSPDGTYSLTHLGPGDNSLTAICAEGHGVLELRAGVPVEPLRLSRGASLTVRLPDDSTWSVSLDQGDVSLSRQDVRNAVSFAGLPPGGWVVYATREDVHAIAEVEISPGGSAEVSLVVAPEEGP